jgi:hypothetical protein
MFFGDEKKDALRRLFALMEKIEKPLAGATVPGEVVVLVSRISEDEWMLAHAPKVGPRADLTDAMVQSGCWAQPADRIAWEFSKNAECSQGLRSTQATMQALIRLGIPFRMQFVESLKPAGLAGAKAVIIPFCTHISKSAAAVLMDTEVGRKEIVFAHLGEFSGAGGARGMPAFGGPHKADFEGEASDVLRDAAGRKRLAEAIGDVFDVHATCESEEIERTWLRLADGGVALFLINWSDKPQTVQVSLPGGAKATLLDTSGGSLVLAPKFTVEVPGLDARIIIQTNGR